MAWPVTQALQAFIRLAFFLFLDLLIQADRVATAWRYFSSTGTGSLANNSPIYVSNFTRMVDVMSQESLLLANARSDCDGWKGVETWIR